MNLLKACVIGVVLMATLMMAAATLNVLMGVVSNVSKLHQDPEWHLNCNIYPDARGC